MHQQARLAQVFDIDLPAVAEIVATAVSRHGWRIKFMNENLRQLSAFENLTERNGQDIWRFDYDLFVKWATLPSGIEIDVTVTEKQMQWTAPDCEKRCNDILDGITDAIDGLNEMRRTAAPPDAYGSAKWADGRDLQRADYIADGKDHRRLLLGPSDQSKYISIPEPETAMHATVCGPTGCGKSSTIYIPNLLLRTGTSAIVTEATAGAEEPDLFARTAGFRKTAGHEIYKFNPDDLTSHRINPLQHIKTYDQAAQVAALIIQNTSTSKQSSDPIWENSERQLLTVLILHAISENASLGTIRRWLREGPEGLGMILMNSQIEEARQEFWGFYSASSEGFRCGVISGLMQRLNLWVTPRIVALTEQTDIDLSALKDQLFTFYLAVPAHKTHLKPLSALIFNFILNIALEQKFKHPLALFLDEFTNYGTIPGIAEKLTIIRHRNIPAMLGFQDYVQLRKVYDDNDAALLFGQPGTKIFFRPRDQFTAKRISDALGTRTVVDRKTNSGGQIHERQFGRPLMTLGEVMSLPGGHALAFTPSTSPLLLKTFSWQQFKEPMSYPPPQFRKLDVNEELVRSCNESSTKADWQRAWESNKYAKGRKRHKTDEVNQVNRNDIRGDVDRYRKSTSHEPEFSEGKERDDEDKQPVY
jgi:type IV secretory pathway TraG/TraD family ATPase VirD4